MKDLNTAIFLCVLGLLLLTASIFAPIYSIVIRLLLAMFSVVSFYNSYSMYFSKGRRREDIISS
ncbi:hypothetical protein HNQ42_000306 [Rummeliibacillus stabekisii]|nr:hypothetical protein [Rummeliibacillus stabekisii]